MDFVVDVEVEFIFLVVLEFLDEVDFVLNDNGFFYEFDYENVSIVLRRMFIVVVLKKGNSVSKFIEVILNFLWWSVFVVV